jgi:hypothetical protein
LTKITGAFRIYRINDHRDFFAREEWKPWFLKAIQTAKKQGFRPPQSRKGVYLLRDWDYIQVVPMEDWRTLWSGNAGMQGWRHKQTGYTIPDYCRLSRGTPEMWEKERHKYRRQVIITNLRKNRPYIIVH